MSPREIPEKEPFTFLISIFSTINTGDLSETLKSFNIFSNASPASFFNSSILSPSSFTAISAIASLGIAFTFPPPLM